MRRVELGWRPSAIEWERDIVPEGADRDQWAEEIPYGLQVSKDCAGLVENPTERKIITLALDMIVEDCPLSRVAAELNQRGFLTRAGEPVDAERSVFPAAADDPGRAQAVHQRTMDDAARETP